MVESDIPSAEVSGNIVPPQAYVYVIAASDEAVKIGVAKNIQKRLRGLQTAHSRKLSVVYEIACLSRIDAYAIEGRAHELLEASALEGEWFDVSADDARTAVERAIAEIREERRRKQEVAKNAAKAGAEVAPIYLGPEITPAEPWMCNPMDLIGSLIGQEGGSQRQYLFDFGDCILFVDHRKEEETGEHFFFMNDVTRWHMRTEDGKACDGATANNPLGNPPCAFFATVFEPSRAAA